MGSWTADALNMRRYGQAAEVVVLSHGFGWDQRVWSPYIEPLWQHFSVITYDLACSPSADPEFFNMARHHDLGSYVEDLMEILDQAQIERCMFVGHSVSGMVGLLASLRQNDRFSKIVTLGASPCYLNVGEYHGGLSEEDIKGLLMAIASNYRNWAQNYAPVAVDRPLGEEATSNFLNSLLAMRPDVTLSTAQMILLGDYRNSLERIHVPTHILQTRKDAAVPLFAATYLHDHIRGSALEILNASGHMPHVTSIDIVLPTLLQCLAPRASGPTA